VVLGKEIIKVVFNYWLISYQNILGIARGLMKLCRRPEEMICLGQIIKMLPCFPMKEGKFLLYEGRIFPLHRKWGRRCSGVSIYKV
jgi:hypothetical protein